jgi:hypothetical protein
MRGFFPFGYAQGQNDGIGEAEGGVGRRVAGYLGMVGVEGGGGL